MLVSLKEFESILPTAICPHFLSLEMSSVFRLLHNKEKSRAHGIMLLVIPITVNGLLLFCGTLIDYEMVMIESCFGEYQ